MGTGLHEEYARDYHVEAASNKRFGLVVGAILLLFGCIRAYFHGEIGWFSALLGGIGHRKPGRRRGRRFDDRLPATGA